MTATLHCGDVRQVLATLPEQSVQCVVTSPPYFGLRDYGTAQWDGGDAGCGHVERMARNDERTIREIDAASGRRPNAEAYASDARGAVQFRGSCGKCGARRVDNQLGLERTPEEYVANMVAVFREVRRVLRDDGVLWLNLGDSYASTGETGRNDAGRSLRTERDDSRKAQAAAQAPRSERRRDRPEGLKQKDLVGIPWMVAFALRADGWYLRSDIIWAKPNPMPESVTDRPTKAHEYLFLLTKSERYYYDAAAIAEDLARPDLALVTRNRGTDSKGSNRDRNDTERRGVPYAPNGNRNARTVWTIATQPYAGAHFATFPEELARRCILAGSAAKACESCGAPWERVTEIVGHDKQRWKPGEDQAHAHKRRPSGGDPRHGATSAFNTGLVAIRETTGHAPTCACEANTGTAQSTVLDPFGGSGTVAAVATGHGRRAIYVDLNPEYLDLAEHRIGPMLCERAEPIVEDVA